MPIDNAEKRLLLSHLGEQAEDREPNEERTRSPARA
mgnify:CR=1 FL=1